MKSLGISGAGRFKFSYAPWLNNEFVKSHFIEDTRKWEHIPMDEVIIYKGSSCGASEALANDWQKMWDRVQKNQEGLNNYMEDLKSKYPDYIFGSLLKSKNHGIIILDEAVDISEIEPLDSIVGVKRASEIRKKFMLPILGDL